MTTAAPTGPVSIKGTTASLSILKSIEDLDTFMSVASNKELNSKFNTMIKEFQETESKTSSSSATMNKAQRGFSLSQILAQSLQNGDKQMLEAALCVSSAQHAKVLQVSLMRLPAVSVLPLLEAITKRLTIKPRRAMYLMPWLKNLLLCHAAYLSTVPSAAKMLAPLQQSIEERMSTLNPMQKLAGRLELIMKQAELREMVKIQDTQISEEPLAVYDESEPETESEDDLEYADQDMSEDEDDEMDVSDDEKDEEEMEEDDEEDDDDDEESFDEDEDEEDYE